MIQRSQHATRLFNLLCSHAHRRTRAAQESLEVQFPPARLEKEPCIVGTYEGGHLDIVAPTLIAKCHATLRGTHLELSASLVIRRHLFLLQTLCSYLEIVPSTFV